MFQNFLSFHYNGRFLQKWGYHCSWCAMFSLLYCTDSTCSQMMESWHVEMAKDKQTLNLVFSLTVLTVYTPCGPALIMYQLYFALIFSAMCYFTSVCEVSVIKRELRLLHAAWRWWWLGLCSPHVWRETHRIFQLLKTLVTRQLTVYLFISTRWVYIYDQKKSFLFKQIYILL